MNNTGRLKRWSAMLGLAALLAMGTPVWAQADEAAAAAETPQFELLDLFQLEYANDPQIAPNGRQVVYVRTSMDIMKDRRRGSLWTIDANGENHQPLLADASSYSMPRWSPDGTRLAYITAAEGSPQIYVRWMDTGRTAKIADLTQSPRNLVWSPDGSQLAFVMNVPSQPKPLASLPSAPRGAEWADAPIVIDRLTYRFDGAGFLPHSFSHVFVVPAEGGTPRQVTSGDFNHSSTPAWTPDGESLIISANRREDWEYVPFGSELYEVSLADGSMTALTDRDGPDGSPAVSPDGRYIAYTGFDDEGSSYHLARLSLLDRETGETRVLTEDFDFSMGQPQWAGNESIYTLYDDRGVRKLLSVTKAGSREVLAEGIGGTAIGRPYTSGSVSVAANGAFATVVTRGGDRPADLAVANARRSELRRLTDLNGDLFDHKPLGAVTEITYPSSADGREIQAWYVTPPNFDPEQQYPLLLEIHGGPHTAYGPEFSSEVQLFAAAGYVVLYVNPRGSTSYGEEFARLIDKNYPSEDYDDLISGVDAMIETGFIDADQLFVTGGSGGGVLTAWIVGKTDRFAAAVVAKPVINWTSFTLTADAYSFFSRYWFTALPWEDQAQYWDRSPLSLVGNVSTPTMLLTGDADLRTPMSETEQYYQALQLRKVDTAMVRIPGASHGIASRPSQLMAKVGYILAWFDRYRDSGDEEDAGDETGPTEE